MHQNGAITWYARRIVVNFARCTRRMLAQIHTHTEPLIFRFRASIRPIESHQPNDWELKFDAKKCCRTKIKRTLPVRRPRTMTNLVQTPEKMKLHSHVHHTCDLLFWPIVECTCFCWFNDDEFIDALKTIWNKRVKNDALDDAVSHGPKFCQAWRCNENVLDRWLFHWKRFRIIVFLFRRRSDANAIAVCVSMSSQWAHDFSWNAKTTRNTFNI